MNTLLFIAAFFLLYIADSSAQMPPPGYERAVKIQEERNKISRMELDSMVLIDTVLIFDPDTYEEETQIMTRSISLKDYCTTYLGMGNPDILLDHQPHIIIDPKTYEEITIMLTPDGKIQRTPKKP